MQWIYWPLLQKRSDGYNPRPKKLEIVMTFIDKLIGADNKIVLGKIQEDWIPNVEPKLLESEKFLLNPHYLGCLLDL